MAPASQEQNQTTVGMRISFIVLTYNRTDALLPVLQSLAAQCDENHEVLIADDGSRADQVSMLYAQCPSFKCRVLHLWHHDTGFTIAKARNLAVLNATGDYLVFLDGDCVPDRDFIVQHTRLAQIGFFVNGSRVLLSERLTARAINTDLVLPRQSAMFWCKARWQGDCNKLSHLIRWPLHLFRMKRHLQWIGIRGCNLAMWRSDLVRVNGFDETFQGWGHEDADLILRLVHLGVRRKNGFMATEVFHLWHRENTRDLESVNRARVLERVKSRRVLAERGLEQAQPSHDIKVTELYR